MTCVPHYHPWQYYCLLIHLHPTHRQTSHPHPGIYLISLDCQQLAPCLAHSRCLIYICSMKEGSQNLLYSRAAMSRGLLVQRPFLNVLFLVPRPAGHSLQPTTGEHIRVAVPSILSCHQRHMCPWYVGVSNPFTLSAQPIRTIITVSVDCL